MRYFNWILLCSLSVFGTLARADTAHDYFRCRCGCYGYNGPGGPCYDGPGGVCYSGPGGPLYDGPGGALYSGPGGPLYDGPGGNCYFGPGGPCYSGPGGSGTDCNPLCYRRC